MKKMRNKFYTTMALLIGTVMQANAQILGGLREVESEVNAIGYAVCGIILFVGGVQVAKSYSNQEQEKAERALKSWGTAVAVVIIMKYVVDYAISQAGA